MKFAICNELFEGWTLGDVCREVKGLGYTGIEVAPFTLAPKATDVTPAQRRQLRQEVADTGVAMVGLHWLLAKVEGYHINTPDKEIRKRSADYLRELVKLCADLGGELMVFGSPGGRKVLPEVTRAQAYEYAADTIRQFAPALAEHNVTFCLEPLSTAETNFMNSADDAVELMRLIDHPNIAVHLDVKAMSAESKPIPQIIRAHAAHTGHFHANDPNMRGPGMGKVDFVPIFQALKEVDYSGWVSVEVFDFKPDPVTIARESIQYMLRTSGISE